MRAIAGRFSRLYLLGLKKRQQFNQTKLQTSWSRLCQALSCRNCLRPRLWSTMANEGYICGFWVHIHFAVCGNAVALLSQHFSRTLQEKVSWNFENSKEGVLKCKKCDDSNIADTFLQQGCKSNRTSENESSSLGPDFNVGVCPSSSSSASCDSEPDKKY